MTQSCTIEKSEDNPEALRSAINANCLDCCQESETEISQCDVEDCPLWNVRPGRGSRGGQA